MKWHFAFFIGISTVLFVSCSNNDPVHPQDDLTTIDLTVGSKNTYVYFVTEDSGGVAKETYRDTFAVRVEADSQTIGNYSNLIKIKAYEVKNDSHYAISWYKQSAVELVDVAYQHAGGAPVIFPKREAKKFLLLNDYSSLTVLRFLTNRFSSSPDTMVRTDLRMVYKYQLSTGKSWTSFVDPFLQTREVIGKEVVALPVGMFNCTKIKTLMPIDAPSMEWYDYVSYEGLIARTISDSVVIASETSPEGDGTKKKVTMSLQLLQRTQQ